MFLLGGLAPRPADGITLQLPGERPLVIHGFLELRLQLVGDDLPSNGVTLSQFRHLVHLETELPLLPDGAGPLDFVLLYTRWQASYECVYERGCGLFRFADEYGGARRSVRELPRTLQPTRSPPGYVGGTSLVRRQQLGTLRPTGERLNPGRRPSPAINAPGVTVSANPFSFLANANTRTRLDAPIDLPVQVFFKTRGGAYNTNFHTTYLIAGRSRLGDPTFLSLLDDYLERRFLSGPALGQIRVHDAAVWRALQAGASAEQVAPLVEARDALLLTTDGAGAPRAVLDYHTIDPELQRLLRYPDAPLRDQANLIATRPDPNVFEALARQTAPELLYAGVGEHQFGEGARSYYFSSTGFPVRPLGYFDFDSLDIINNSEVGFAEAIGRLDLATLPNGAPPGSRDLRFGVVPYLLGPDGRRDTSDDLPETGPGLSPHLRVDTEIPDSAWSTADGAIPWFKAIAYVDDPATPEFETVDDRSSVFATSGKPLILFGIGNPDFYVAIGCSRLGGALQEGESDTTCVAADGERLDPAEVSRVGCNFLGAGSGINRQGECVVLNQGVGSARIGNSMPGVHFGLIPLLADPRFRPVEAFTEPLDLADLRSFARTATTAPARPRAPGNRLFFQTRAVRDLVRRTHGLVSNLDLDFDEDELRFGHGASDDEHEFREGYLEIEALRGQVFARIGKLLMTWGKTELARHTDLLNPGDLSGSLVGRLEEARVGQWGTSFIFAPDWAARLGSMRDLRLELVALFDDFEPTDLGNCGEPLIPIAVCALQFGAVAHGLSGTGLVGAVRPEARHSGLELFDFGARIEGRWKRFAFSLSDFWGWDDASHVEIVHEYSRRVDPETGAPVNANGPLDCKHRVNADGERVGPNGVAGDGDDQFPSVGNCLLFDSPAAADARQAVRVSTEIAASHFANQTLFHTICTLSWDPDRGYCAYDQTNDPEYFAFISLGLVGDSLIVGGAFEGIETLRFSNQPVTIPGYAGSAPASRAAEPIFAKTRITRKGLPALRPEQKALLGCGEAFLAPCGKFGEDHPFLFEPEFAELVGVPDGGAAVGGLDLMNADASVLMQEFAILKALQPGAAVGTRPGPDGLRYEAGITLVGAEATTRPLGLTAERLAGMGLHERAAMLRSALVDAGQLAEDEALPASDAWIEPMPWKVDPEQLARGLVVFKVADRTHRDPRCDPDQVPGGGARSRDASGAPVFSDRERAYCTGRHPRWPDDPELVLLNDPTDPTNPDNSFVVPFDGDESDLFDPAGGPSEKLRAWVRDLTDVSEQCTAFLATSFISTARSQFDEGCTDLETVSGNLERFFTAVEIVGGDRFFDPPETLAEILAMLDGDERNDAFGDPIAGRDGIYTRNLRVFRDGIQNGVNDLHAVSVASGTVLITPDAIAPGFDFDGDGAPDGAATLELSELSMREFFRGFHPETACPSLAVCYLLVGQSESVVELEGGLPVPYLEGAALPVSVRAELRSLDGEAIGSLDREFRRPRINLLELFEERPLAFASLLSGFETTIEDFTLRYDRGGRYEVTGDVVLQLLRGVVVAVLETSLDNDRSGVYDLDQDRDGVYDGLDDGSPGPVSDDAILCGSGIPGDILQSASQYELMSDEEEARLAAVLPDGLPVRSPVHCAVANIVLGGSGQTLPLREAGGDGRYGRRDFLWHGGQELVLAYEKRNVLAFGLDFAHDASKSSWGLELSWSPDRLITDTNARSGLSRTDEWVLSISVDRPTWLRVLNPSESFFLNLQLALRYLTDFNGGRDDRDGNYAFAPGPLSAQLALTAGTQFFQGRMQPGMTIVWDPSVSGAVAFWRLGYRFRSEMTVSLGVTHIFGHFVSVRRSLFPPVLYSDPKLHSPSLSRGNLGGRNQDAVSLSMRFAF